MTRVAKYAKVYIFWNGKGPRNLNINTDLVQNQPFWRKSQLKGG